MLGDTAAYQGLRGGKEPVPAAVTDIGCEREINEDRYAVIDSPVGRIWIVCDGMGGTLGGELAAQLAIDAMRRAIQTANGAEASETLARSIQEANRVIVLRRQNPAFSAMGTTIVACLVRDDEVVLSHAGDSRAYLVRGPEVQQLTTDHTYVQDLVERGVINAGDALSHPQAHVLTRCLGAEPRLDLETQTFWIWSGDGSVEDKLILCTDGLYSLVTESELAEIVSRQQPQEACAELTELAKTRGGFDNITLAIVPLGGQLREEKPAKPRSRVGKRSVTVDNTPPLSWGAKLSVMFFLALIGSVITALAMLWRMSSS